MREFERELEREFEFEQELETEIVATPISRPPSDRDILNLGCGDDYRPNAWNVDASPDVDADEVVDLQRTPWPWPDASFRVVKARHVLEHLETVPWAEIVRVLAPGGAFVWTYPIGQTRFEDPTHRHYWNWNTAAALAGDRKHAHEFVSGLRLVNRKLSWHVSGRLFRTYTRLRLSHGGPGAWLSQVPGLSGEVTATYRRVE